MRAKKAKKAPTKASAKKKQPAAKKKQPDLSSDHDGQAKLAPLDPPAQTAEKVMPNPEILESGVKEQDVQNAVLDSGLNSNNETRGASTAEPHVEEKDTHLQGQTVLTDVKQSNEVFNKELEGACSNKSVGNKHNDISAAFATAEQVPEVENDVKTAEIDERDINDEMNINVNVNVNVNGVPVDEMQEIHSTGIGTGQATVFDEKIIDEAQNAATDEKLGAVLHYDESDVPDRKSERGENDAVEVDKTGSNINGLVINEATIEEMQDSPPGSMGAGHIGDTANDAQLDEKVDYVVEDAATDEKLDSLGGKIEDSAQGIVSGAENDAMEVGRTGDNHQMLEKDQVEILKREGDAHSVPESMLVSERRKQKKLELFVGGLDKEATEVDLKQVFGKAGEITEIRLMRNPQTGKNKGYAFIRYANAEQAKQAAEEFEHVEVCGRTCGVLPSEENDILFLGNISKTWKRDNVMETLNILGIDGLDELTLMEDPQNEGNNRGFAFLEFTTHRDALRAFKRLQRSDAVFGGERSAKVAWAQPLSQPDDEVMSQVKSVFVDGMPPHWDEERVKDHFGKYGKVERVVLARNMSSAKRKDFGFVNYSTREAALACIKALNNIETMDGNTKIKMRVELAKPQLKNKNVKGGVRGGFRLGRLSEGFGGKDSSLRRSNAKNRKDTRGQRAYSGHAQNFDMNPTFYEPVQGTKRHFSSMHEDLRYMDICQRASSRQRLVHPEFAVGGPGMPFSDGVARAPFGPYGITGPNAGPGTFMGGYGQQVQFSMHHSPGYGASLYPATATDDWNLQTAVEPRQEWRPQSSFGTGSRYRH